MRRISYTRPLLLCAVTLSLLAWPAVCVEKIRNGCLKCLPWHTSTYSPSAEYQRLEAENHLLRLELLKLHEVCAQLGYTREENNKALCAHVIYRDPLQWSSSCWIDVGEQTNREYNQTVVGVYSPVVVGHSLVGMIDFVGEKRARVRLITDIALKPSVCAVRGHPQETIFQEHLTALLTYLTHYPDSKDKQNTMTLLRAWQRPLKEETTLLAKGIIQGSGTPLWRGRGHLLRGIGFNNDFVDKGEPTPLLQIHDILVTTGMDGIFPKGLPVAEVTHLFPIREGDCTYTIEAQPIIKNLDTLTTVCVLPPCAEQASLLPICSAL